MFEVGFTELLLIFALALVVLGPEKLPRVAAQVGRWVGRAKAMARQFREQLEQEAATLDPDSESNRRAAARPQPEPPSTGYSTPDAPDSTSAPADGSPPDWATGAPVEPPAEDSPKPEDAPAQGELPYNDPYADQLHSHGDSPPPAESSVETASSPERERTADSPK